MLSQTTLVIFVSTDPSVPRTPLTFLAHDWVVQAFAAVLLAQIGVYTVPLVDAATLHWVGSTAYLMPYVLLAVVAAFEGLGAVRDRAERRFWSWMGGGCVIWLATLSGVAIINVKGWTPPLDLASDGAYMLFYVVLMAAVELRPDVVDLEGRFVLERNLRWAGLAVLVVGWFAYFVIVPLVVDPRFYETTRPSSLYFVTLDVIMLVRFSMLARGAGPARWRLLYAGLGVATAALLACDALDALAAGGVVRFPNGRLTDLFWLSAPAAFVAAFRLSRAPIPSGLAPSVASPDLLRSLDPVRVGGLLVAGAFTFPAAHFVLQLIVNLNPAIDRALHGVVLAAMSILGALAIVAYRRLERHRTGHERSRAALEDRLRQAHKLEAVGRVTGAVSHELGNALNAVALHVDRAVEELGTEHPAASELLKAQDASKRAATFTRDLLVVSRKRPVVPRPLNLNATLRAAESTIRDTVGSRVAVDLQLSPDAGHVLMGLDAFQAVLTTLVMNARDAMPEGGALHIETGRVILEPDRAFVQALRPGRYGRFLVADTGAGIPSHVMGHLFEPFFTTKDRTGGSGLGLAMAYSLVTQHGGQITARSEDMRGAEFEILLPAADPPAAEARPGD
ncbi:MAG: ATP-binding protein [Acidobacteriota bacterium]